MNRILREQAIGKPLTGPSVPPKSEIKKLTSIAGNGYPRVGYITLALLFCYVFAHYIEINTRIELFEKIRFEWLLGLALTIIGVITGNIFRLGDNKKVLFAVLFFYFIVAVQVPLSQDYEQSVLVFLNRFVKLSFMALFIVAFVRSPFHMKVFIAGFLLACMKLGQEGLVGKITGSMMWENQGVMRLHGQGAIYGHPNSLSGNALGTLPFLWYLFPLFAWPIKSAILMQFLFAMNIVVFTGSRTGYVGFIGLLSYIVMRGKNKFRILMLVFALIILGACIVPSQYVTRLDTIFTGKDIEGGSIAARKVILEDAVEIFMSNPLGVGVGAFPMVRARTFGRFQDTHNLYLEILTNTGIQGGIAFFIMIILIFKSLGEIENRYKSLLGKMESCWSDGGREYLGNIKIFNKHVMDLRFLLAICQAVKLFLILRLILGMFGMDLYEVYWWFVIGLTLALGNIYPWAEKKTISLNVLVFQEAKV